ncbi:unnamed protein product [Prunus brigantina]
MKIHSLSVSLPLPRSASKSRASLAHPVHCRSCQIQFPYKPFQRHSETIGHSQQLKRQPNEPIKLPLKKEQRLFKLRTREKQASRAEQTSRWVAEERVVPFWK